MADDRNRSALARDKGKFLRAFELSAECDQLINDARDYLATLQGTATRVQALEWLVRQGIQVVYRRSKRVGEKVKKSANRH